MIAWIPLLPWFPGNFRDSVEFWRFRGNSRKFRENSGEFSGIQWGFVWCLIWIQWEFLGDFGATPGFWKTWVFGVVSGDLGPQKAFAQIASPTKPQDRLDAAFWLTVGSFPLTGRLIFYHYWCWRPGGRSTGKEPVPVIISSKIPEKSQKLLPVLVLNFGYGFAFQYWYW